MGNFAMLGRPSRLLCAVALCCSEIAAAVDVLPPPWLPVEPGRARCEVADGRGVLSNEVLTFAVYSAHGSLRPARFENRFVHRSTTLEGELFQVKTRAGQSISASDFRGIGELRCESIDGKEHAAREAERLPGIALRGELQDTATGLQVTWQAVLRDATNYVREEFEIAAESGADLASITLIDLALTKASVAGTADGSPLVAGDEF